MNIVKELRRKKGVTQIELAEIIGVSQPTISEWEKNSKDPSGERLQKLAQYFDVDELVILGRGYPGMMPLLKNVPPKTIEARILAQGIDKLTQEQREMALNVVRAMFAQHSELFEKGYYVDET